MTEFRNICSYRSTGEQGEWYLNIQTEYGDRQIENTRIPLTDNSERIDIKDIASALDGCAESLRYLSTSIEDRAREKEQLLRMQDVQTELLRDVGVDPGSLFLSRDISAFFADNPLIRVKARKQKQTIEEWIKENIVSHVRFNNETQTLEYVLGIKVLPMTENDPPVISVDN